MCGYVRYVVLCCVMLHLSCCGMFCYVTLRSVTFRYVVVCCVMLCRVMSCHATLCHVMLCNVMLCYGMDACIYAIGSYPAAPIVFSVHSRLQTRQRRLLQNEPIVVDPCDCGVQVLLPEIAKRGLALLLILALQMAAELLLGLGG